MKLTLIGHDDRYAVEQLQLALFPEGTEGEAVSSLHRGSKLLTAITKITLNGKTATGIRRLKVEEESVRERRRALQQSYYKAAVQLLPAEGGRVRVYQKYSPYTDIDASEVLLQGKQDKGIPMVMALLDDVVTEMELLPPEIQA